MVHARSSLATGSFRNLPSGSRSRTGAGSSRPAGSARVAYFGLHGSPRKYWSRYDEGEMATLATTIRGISIATEVWCVFDNTASGAAIENASELRERLVVAHLGM